MRSALHAPIDVVGKVPVRSCRDCHQKTSEHQFVDRQRSRVPRCGLCWSSWHLHSHAVSAHLRASTESQKSEHFHCWCQTLRLRGVLFHPASEKEIVRDVTEKRLIHRVFIATQSPNRLPQKRRLFVISQRNVCYIVFSSRHRAQIDCRREGDCS